MFAGHPCEIFLIKKQLFSRKMLNKRKLKYNFGTECILLKTVYNNQNIFMLKQKSEIYIWFKSAFFTNGVGPTSLGSHPLANNTWDFDFDNDDDDDGDDGDDDDDDDDDNDFGDVSCNSVQGVLVAD